MASATTFSTVSSSTDRRAFLTRGMKMGFMLNFLSPKPSRTSADSGSAAISPQTVTSLPALTARPDDGPDQPQDGRVEGLVEVGNELVRPVDRQVILDEVVRPDAQVIHLLEEMVGHGRGRRDLDHRAEGDLLIERLLRCAGGRP